MGGYHVGAFEDNLVPTLTPEQIVELRCRPVTARSSRPAPAARHPTLTPRAPRPCSRSNAFGGWLGREQRVTAAGVRGFSRRLEVENKQPIHRSGRARNLEPRCAADRRRRRRPCREQTHRVAHAAPAAHLAGVLQPTGQPRAARRQRVARHSSPRSPATTTRCDSRGRSSSATALGIARQHRASPRVCVVGAA